MKTLREVSSKRLYLIGKFFSRHQRKKDMMFGFTPNNYYKFNVKVKGERIYLGLHQRDQRSLIPILEHSNSSKV